MWRGRMKWKRLQKIGPNIWQKRIFLNTPQSVPGTSLWLVTNPGSTAQKRWNGCTLKRNFTITTNRDISQVLGTLHRSVLKAKIVKHPSIPLSVLPLLSLFLLTSLHLSVHFSFSLSSSLLPYFFLSLLSSLTLILPSWPPSCLHRAPSPLSFIPPLSSSLPLLPFPLFL